MEKFLKTTELALVATLQCLGYGIEAIEKVSGNKAAFLVSKDDKLDNLVQDYWNQKLKVEPQKYFQAIKAIKSRIYNN